MKKIILSVVFGFLAIYYVNAQEWVWDKQFSSTGNVTPVDIVMGNDNNVYVAGLYTQSLTIGSTTLPYSDINGKEDIFLCSFSSNGTFRWARQIGGNNAEDLGGIAVDNNNNIYLVGGFQSSILTFPPSVKTLTNTTANVFDAFLAKYDNGGNLIFADSTFWGTSIQRLKDVAVDFTNNRLVLVGQFQVQLRYFDGSVVQTIPVQGTKDHFIALYDLNLGYISNIKTYKSSLLQTVFKTVNNCVYGGNVQGYFVCGDLKGKLYLPGGDTLKGDEVNMDAMVIRYDANLNYLWSRRGGGTSWDHVNSAARDDNGNIYIAGKCQSNPSRFDSTKTVLSSPLAGFGVFDYYLAKYNRNGNLQWIRRKGGSCEDNAYGLAVKKSRVVTAGNICYGGNIETGFDLYDVNGNFIKGDVITGSGEDQGQGVAFNSSADSIFITGYFKSDTLHCGPLTLINTVAGLQDGFFVKYGYKFKIFLEEKTNITCNSGNDGYIKVSTQFGVNPITYSWTPNVSSTFEASGLAAGSYKIKATDNSGQKDSINVTITQPGAITITTTLLKNVTCYGGEDGEIQVTVAGGTIPRTLTWSGPDNLVQNSTIQTGLLSGTYKLVVVDANGCTTEKIFIVSQPLKTTFSESSVNGITVPPSCNGAVNLEVSGGTPDYTYDWSGPSGYSSTNDNIAGLCNGGNYDLEVTDSKSCIQDTTFFVPVDTGLNIIICAKTDVSCKGELDGYAKVCVTLGGTGNYTYAWRTSGGNPVGGNDPELIDVVLGTYYVKVTDNGNLKSAETSVKIEEPAVALTPYFNEIRNISCYGKTDGYIDLGVLGGWSPYDYEWNFGDTIQDVSNLPKGVKFVTVTDANNCIILLDTSISEPSKVAITSVTVYDSITCQGDADGALWAHATGGTPPYLYLWDDDGCQNDSIATDLYSRLYAVNVTDAMGCKAIKATKILYEPFEIEIGYSKSDVKCKGGSDGSITLNPSGGTPPYTYAWDDNPVTKDRSGLLPGTYCVTVTDYHGCTAYSCVDITEPSTAVAVDSTKVTDISCFGDSDGTIAVYASGGTGVLTFTITPGGTSNITGIFVGLSAGNYTVEVKDANLCSVTTGTLTVGQPGATITIERTIDSVSCYGGSNGAITTDISGGTSPYDCSWADGPTICDRTGLTIGEYYLTVTDAHGCIQDSMFIVSEPAPLSIDRNITEVTSYGGSDGAITTEISGGTPQYTCSWADGSLDCDRTGLVADTFIITVTDAHGCTLDSTFIVSGPTGTEQLFIETGISLYPNPTTGKLTVEIEARDHKGINLEIMNMLGQVIWKKDLQYNGQPRFVEVIDMSQQAKGTYFMRVNGLSVHTKILLE
jgi:hypothetical protein